MKMSLLPTLSIHSVKISMNRSLLPLGGLYNEVTIRLFILIEDVSIIPSTTGD
jgi:hypothetical protein